MPPGRGVVPPFDQNTPEEAAGMSPVIMRGVWEDRKADHDFRGRLRSDHTAPYNALHILDMDCASHHSHGLCCSDQLPLDSSTRQFCTIKFFLICSAPLLSLFYAVYGRMLIFANLGTAFIPVYVEPGCRSVVAGHAKPAKGC